MATQKVQMPAVQAGGASPGLATEQGGRMVKIEFYDGAKFVLTLHLPNGIQEKIETNRSRQNAYGAPDWLGKVVNYLYLHGRKREVRTYNPVARREYVWLSYEAEIPAKELLHMIKSAKTWQMSKHARRIVELLENVS